MIYYNNHFTFKLNPITKIYKLKMIKVEESERGYEGPLIAA